MPGGSKTWSAPEVAALSASSSRSSWAKPRCSMLDARREEYTIWTAIAPEAVFTVRT
jgi:hypothetical protein